MKSFLRVLVALLVIGVLVYEVYYLVTKNNTYIEEHPEVLIEEVKEESKSGEKVEEQPNIKVTVKKTKEEIISDIKEIERENINASVTSTTELLAGTEVIGAEYKEMFEALGSDTTNVTIQVAGTMIHVIPYSDFVDDQEFHYDIYGNLVMYAYTEIGRGLKTRFYLNDKEIIKIEKEEEEEVENPSGEVEIEIVRVESGENKVPTETNPVIDLDDVLSRAETLYKNYMFKAE